MSDAALLNIQAFEPFDGGIGKRLSVTTTSQSAALPGTGENNMKRRVLVTNGGSFSAFVRFGQEGVVATTDCLEILPGTQVLLTPREVGTKTLYFAAIAEAATTLGVVVGVGT